MGDSMMPRSANKKRGSGCKIQAANKDTVKSSTKRQEDGNYESRLELNCSPKNHSGSENQEFAVNLITQVVEGTCISQKFSDEKMDRVILASLAALEGINPRDEIEGQLAAQMVVSHNAGMEAFRRAFLPQQSFEATDIYLKQGTKLSRLFTEQMAALKKYRGESGNQIVTVKHQHVEVNSVGATQVNAFPQGGVEEKPKEQPHAKQIADASESPLRCKNPPGETLPVTSGQGKETLSHAWRNKGQRST
jgi:hypothetical protein